MTTPTRALGDAGQCEAVDLIPTDETSVAVRCTRMGRCITERSSGPLLRIRFVCPLHGLTSAMEVN